jgi:predicted Zn-dependent peptidase
MKILVISLSAILLASSTVAEKAPLPKDLPPYGPEVPLAAPAVKSTKLDNGLTVWLVSKPGFPKVAITLAVRGGFATDPADRPGISDLLTKTIDQGTATRTAKQIAQDLQGAGGDLSANPGKDSLIVSTSFLSSKSDKAITAFADVVRNAGFPDAEVTLAKRNAIDDLKQKESEPSFLASRAMGKVLFGNHPYHVTSPTEESITASTATDLQRIYAERFRPEGVVGGGRDFENEADARGDQVPSTGGRLPTAPVPEPEVFAATPQHRLHGAGRLRTDNTAVRMFGPLRSDSDYRGSPGSQCDLWRHLRRLTSRIREDKGFTETAVCLFAAISRGGRAGDSNGRPQRGHRTAIQ